MVKATSNLASSPDTERRRLGSVAPGARARTVSLPPAQIDHAHILAFQVADCGAIGAR